MPTSRTRIAHARTEGVFGSPIRNLAVILTFMALVVSAATIAYMAAGWSFSDASYMVLLTVYTVGYGEVHPIDTPYLHTVTVATMVLGCTGMILLTSTLVQFFTVMQLRELLGDKAMSDRIEKLSHHVIVCGYGRIGLMLAQELAAAGAPLIVLERNADRLAEAEAAGHIVLAADATEEEALVRAGVGRARLLATVLPDDAANVFITLSARSLSPHIEIIARGEVPSTESKLRQAGANHVVLPTHISAERIARMVLHPASEAAEEQAGLSRMAHDFALLGMTLERFTVGEQSPLVGLDVGRAEARASHACFIVAIVRDGEPPLFRPTPDQPISATDEIAVVGRLQGTSLRALLES